MKTVQDYIKEAYKDCYINEKQVPFTDWLIWFNRAIHDIERKLVQYIKTNFFVNKIQQNTVAWTYIYNLPTWTSDWPTDPLIEQFRNVLQVWVKYQSDWDFYRAVPMWPTMNYKHPETLWKDQPTINPLFEFVDNQVRIYPTPLKNVAWWLQIDFQVMKKDYKLTDNENDIPFPRQDHTPILHRLRMYIFNARWKYQEKQQAEADFEKAFNDITIAMSDIYCSPVEDTLPNLTYLKY
jgi:hypothetical protein